MRAKTKNSQHNEYLNIHSEGIFLKTDKIEIKMMLSNSVDIHMIYVYTYVYTYSVVSPSPLTLENHYKPIGMKICNFNFLQSVIILYENEENWFRIIYRPLNIHLRTIYTHEPM